MKREQNGAGAFVRSRGSRWGRAVLVGGLAFLTTVAVGLSEARAQDGAEGRGRQREGPALRARGHGLAMKQLATRLQLTPDQRQQIQSLRQEMRRDLSDEQAQLRQVSQQLRAAWQEREPQDARILELRRQASALRNTIQARREQFRLSVLRLLTPQQRAELQRTLAERARRGAARPQTLQPAD